MDLGLKGKSALILAGSRGLGFGCAAALAAEGVRVVINGLSEENGRRAVAALDDRGHFIRADLNDAGERARLHEEALEYLGSISILVTNADGPPSGSFTGKSLADWQAGFDTVVAPALDMVQRCLPGMIERGFGRIVNISSVSAKEMAPGSVLANSLKPGLIGAFGSLAREIAATGVTVNCILPGPFDTDRMRRSAQGAGRLSLEEATARHARDVPMKRLGTTEEFGSLCAYLCSRQAGFITGQSIVIDGGLVTSLL